MKKIFLIGILSLAILLPTLAQAGVVPCGLSEDDPNQEGDQTVPCTFCHFFVMINTIVVEVFRWVVPIIAILMLVIGGVMFFFAGAKPDPLSRAKGVITSTIIGLIIVFAAWAIVNTILEKSKIVDPVEGKNILEWYKIECPVP